VFPSRRKRAPRRRRWFARLWRIAIPVLLVAVLAVVGYYYRSHQTKPLTDKDSIVLSDFTNTTGDSVFDDTLKQGLSVQLEQSPFLALVSERRVNETLKLMGRPAGERLTPEVTREVCQRTGSKAMLTGSIAKLGQPVRDWPEGVELQHGGRAGGSAGASREQGSGAQGFGRRRDQFRGASWGVAQLGGEIRHAGWRKRPRPSLEALKVYSRGLKTFYAKGARPRCPSSSGRWNLTRILPWPTPGWRLSYHDRDEIAGDGRKWTQGFTGCGRR